MLVFVCACFFDDFLVAVLYFHLKAHMSGDVSSTDDHCLDPLEVAKWQQINSILLCVLARILL